MNHPTLITIRELQSQTDANMKRAAELGVRLRKRRINGKCHGMIYRGDTVLFSRPYDYRYDFISTAFMQRDFHHALVYLQSIPRLKEGMKILSLEEAVKRGLESDVTDIYGRKRFY